MDSLHVHRRINETHEFYSHNKTIPDQNGINGNNEVTKTCSVLGCKEYKSLESNLFFRFPEDTNIRQTWINLTGQSDWIPDDQSYICVIHFSVDSFTCDAQNEMVLISTAVPSLKLPSHVFEVEYIDDESFNEDSSNDDSDGHSMKVDYDTIDKTQLNGDIPVQTSKQYIQPVDIELLKLFTQVQTMQKQVTGLKDKLKFNNKIYNNKKKYLQRLKEIVANKEGLLEHKRQEKLNINMPLLKKIEEETTDLVLALPTKHTDNLKKFALNVYKYSPQAYIYLRNTLRTVLPSTTVLEGWLKSGYQPKNIMTNSNLIKVVCEQSESEISCKILLH